MHSYNELSLNAVSPTWIEEIDTTTHIRIPVKHRFAEILRTGKSNSEYNYEIAVANVQLNKGLEKGFLGMNRSYRHITGSLLSAYR